MRRIIHNTTAIAACLSLLAPQIAMAQAAKPDANSDQPAQSAQGEQPAIVPEVDATAAQPCADGSAAPCGTEQPAANAGAEETAAPEQSAADEMPATDGSVDASGTVAPEAKAEAAAGQGDAGGSTAAPAAPADATMAEDPAAAPEAPAADPAMTDTADPAASEETTATGDAATGEDALADALAKESDQSGSVKAQDTEATLTGETTGGAKASGEATTTSGDMTATGEAQSSGAAEADAAAQQPDATETNAAGAEVTTDQKAETDAREPAKAADSEGADPASDEDALAKALAEESDKTTEADKPADSGAGSGAPEAEASADTKAATEAETTTTTDASGQEAAVPEQDVTETEAAREAAATTEAPTAAALDENAADAEVTEEKVTEDNSRSSSEDFTTNLRDALNSTTGQQNAAQDSNGGDDGKNDLAKALLLGLGGVAVGAMLNNNRQVALSAPDRVVVTRSDGSQQVIKDEVALLRQPGSTVSTENFGDGSSRTIVTRADGSKIVTIRDADLRVLRRTLVSADGSSVRLIDDSAVAEPVDVSSLPAPAKAVSASAGSMDEAQLRDALMRESDFSRRFTLAQIRDIPQVRSLVAPVNIDAITFETGSAAIKPDQAKELSTLGNVIRDAIAKNPREMFLIEGHTDTVGSDAANLALSDRRAESVALALTEYFDVPPENMVIQGYGEQFLKVRQEGDVRENRRAAVRRITDLMQTAQN